jgi:hypothetical protein
MKLSTMTRAIFYTLAVAGLVACGGSGGGSDDGGSDISTSSAASGSTVVGTIAGFGSIIMNNGVEYETDGLSDCEVDDDDVAGKCEDSLSTGMHVTLKLNASGAVTSLKYDDELEGVASNVSGEDGSGNYTFEIYGVIITTTSPETQWDDFNTNPPTIAELEGANIEVSGEWQLDGTVIASYVEEQSDSDSHEVKGTVGVITGSDFPLTLRNGATIDVDASAISQLPVEGDFVELKGSYDGTIFTATDFEVEDEDDFDGDSEAEITGTLAENMNSSTGYSIVNTEVDISGAPSCTALIGSMVEAEGRFNQDTGVLVVEECENEDEDEDMEAKCRVVVDATVPAPEKPKVGSVQCGFPGTTGGPLTIKFNDSPGLAMFSGDSTDSTFDLTDVGEGDCVEIKFSKDSNDDYIAGLIEHEGSGGCEQYELEATVDEFHDGIDITAAGVKFTANLTEYDPDGSNAFLNNGDEVKIEDNNGDGIADKIEVDDD